MSNARRLPRPAKRAAARAVAAASECADCGVRAGPPRRERDGLRTVWIVDVPHEDSCPARRLPGLRDSLSAAAVRKAQPSVAFPLAYLPGSDVVIAGQEAP